MAYHHYQARGIASSYQGQKISGQTPSAGSKVKMDLTHIAELYLQDLNPFKHSDTRATKARELMMLTLAGSMTLTWTFSPIPCWIPHCASLFMNMYVPLALNFPNLAVQGDTTLRNTLGFSLQVKPLLQIKPFLFHSGLVVSFVSTPTKRWTQSQANNAF